MVDVIADDGHAISCMRTTITSPTSTRTANRWRRATTSFRIRLQLEKGNHIGACFMYTRGVYEAVGEYDPELFLVEDYDYFMRIAKRFRMCHLAEPSLYLYYFRRHDDALYVSRFCEVKASDVLVATRTGC